MRKRGLFGIVFVVSVILLCLPVSAQSNILTQIDFPNASAVAEENLSLSGYGDKDSGYAMSMEGGRIYASVSGTDLRKLEWSKGEYGEAGLQPAMTGGTKNPWGNGAYLETRVCTEGYENVTFSAHIGATNKGPRDYKLQYSVDGTTFKDIAGATFTVTANKTLFAAFDNVALPADTANCSMLYIRITVASNMLVNGTAGLIGSTGGETAVNHIKVCATPIATTTQSTTVNTTSSSGDDATTTTVASDPSTTSANDTSHATTTTRAGETTTITPSVNTGDTSQAYVMLGVLLAAGILMFASVAIRKYLSCSHGI